ncbi:hypothetical protein G9C98_006679, partial [Cotesia typhae]
FIRYIDEHKKEYVDTLREAVAIKSVSSWPDSRSECVKMMEWMEKKMKALGASTELADIGMEKLHDGREIPLPPILVGSLGNDRSKKTVLIYGHLDVQPALVEDGWDTEPFTLVEKDNKLFGRGSTDDKGPVLCWLHALQAYKAIGEEIPVNIKFVFEGMEENGSEGLDEFLWSRKESFLSDIDYVCISDNYWLGTTKPCITYGLRGLAYFNLEVSCAKSDLHSGTFGGTVHEAMSDLIFLLNSLVDVNGRILIDGIYDQVDKITDAELKSYQDIEFDVDDEPGAKTVIPRKVIGKFSLRIVPSMTPDEVTTKVKAHLEKIWATRGSPNVMNIHMGHGGKPWTENPDHPHYVAARTATKYVYGVDPDLSREGGSIPVTLTFQEVTGKNVLLLPVGCGDDGAHSQNEKLNIRNYIEGTKLLGSYLYEVSRV